MGIDWHDPVSIAIKQKIFDYARKKYPERPEEDLISQIESAIATETESDLIHKFDPEMKAIIEEQEKTVINPIYIKYKRCIAY